MRERRVAVYVLASRTRTLYVGVTNDLARGISEPKAGTGSKFTRRYSVDRLVHVEWALDPLSAITREKSIKGWTRHRKIALIESDNPRWIDPSADAR